MAAYSYKNTGIEWLGEIPEHWDYDRVKDVSRLRDDKISIKSEELNYLELEDIEQGTGKIYGYRSTVDVASAVMQFKKGDVLFGKLRPYLEKYYYADIDGLCTGEILAIEPKRIHGKFLNYFVGSPNFIKQCNVLSYGTKMPRVNWNTQISTFSVPLPPLPEQKAIAEYLDKACQRIDKIIDIKQKQLEKIEQSFGRKLDETFRDLRNRCDNYKKLKLVVKTTKGLAFKSNLFTDKGHPVVKASDIKEGKINKGETFIDSGKASDFQQVALKKDDIVISTVGSQPRVPKSAVGQLAFVNEEFEGALLNQNTVILRINEIFTLLPLFLYLQLKTSEYREHLDQYARGTANQSSLMLVDILKYKICLPQKDEQEKIITVLSKYNEKTNLVRENIKQQIITLQSYRKSLIHECVTGKKQVWEGEIEKVN